MIYHFSCCQREHEVWENNPGKKICCYFHEPNDTKTDTGGRAINWCDSKHLYGLRTQNFTNVHPGNKSLYFKVSIFYIFHF